MVTSLPVGVQVFERGWLSSNNILLTGVGQSALIDSGYCTHSAQTVALVRSALGDDTPLDLLLNTHLHSDHCGGNAALQDAYAGLKTWIPPGHAAEIARWDQAALSFDATGQSCPRFVVDAILWPGRSLEIAGKTWQVHAAGGHDPHSVILFEASNGILISADALWEQGFGVVFPELDGIDAFDDVATTLDLIEDLSPSVVIPGHGSPFVDHRKALAFARARLCYFTEQPVKHMQYAAKVLLKFRLLEMQSCSVADLLQWVQATPYLERLRQSLYPTSSQAEMMDGLIRELAKSGAAVRQQDRVINGK